MLFQPFNLFNWNPQLFREIKGRLKIRNVAIAISASLLCQFLVMMVFLAKLPEQYGANIVSHSKYCIRARGDYYNCIGTDWSTWWLDVSKTFSWILLVLMLLGGIYMLVADLGKEKRLGTLNFICLTPKPSHNILLGKLLGVPILIYLATAISLPLHLWATILSGLSLYWFLGFYVVLITACCFFYNASLIFVFLGGTQAWLAATVVGIFWLIVIGISSNYIDDFDAFFLIINIKYKIIISLIVLGFILGSYWTWKAVNRLYKNPSATVITKKQSYWLMGCFQIYLLLFFIEYVGQESTKSVDLQKSMFFLLTINLIWFLLVITFLSPQRQTVQDWARYRHQQVNNYETAIVKGLSISLKQDLIWGEKSPALVAIGFNLVMTAVIWISWILLESEIQIKLPAILTLILSLNLILIYAAIAQLVLLMKVQKPTIWAVGILGGLITLPPIALSLFSITPQNHPNLWLFSTFPWLSFPYNYQLITPMLITIISQWSVFTLVTLQLTRKIKKLGESNSQKLLT